MAAILAALTLAQVVTVWEIYLFAALMGVAAGRRRAGTPCARLRDGRPEDLANAVSLNSSLGTAARVLGPAIGGAVVALPGAGVAFGVNSASFLAEVAALLALDTSKLHRPIRDHGATVLGGALDALEFVVHTPRAAVAFFGVFALSTFSFNFNVLLPLVAERTLHSRRPDLRADRGRLRGGGAASGATVNASRGRASLRVLLIGALGYGVFELALAPLHSLVPICARPLCNRRSSTPSGARPPWRRSSSRRPSGSAAARQASTSSPSSAARRSAGSSPAGSSSVGGTAARVLRRGIGGRRDRARLRGDARDDLAGPPDLVVADQPVSDEANAAVELRAPARRVS